MAPCQMSDKPKRDGQWKPRDLVPTNPTVKSTTILVVPEVGS